MCAFQPLNEFYDKIYVLTLPRLTERMDYIRQQLDGLDFEFFFGTDKQHVSLQQLKDEGLYCTKSYQQFYKKPSEIALGMLCCSLGHFQIYDEIVKNGYQRTLILEDDAIPEGEQLAKFPAIINELPQDWDIFYLGYEKNETAGFKQKINRAVYQLIPYHSQLKMTPALYAHFYPRKLSAHIARAGFHDCTHAYAITLDAAKTLLTYRQPVRFHPDNLLSYLHGIGLLKAYISRPKLFNQRTAFNHQAVSLTSD